MAGRKLGRTNATLGAVFAVFSRAYLGGNYAVHKKAFTLIELLVVIAIIAILAAILFPVFSRAKETAKRTACLSNQRQMSMCVMMYTDDHNSTLPMSTNYAQPTSEPYRVWMSQVYPYVENKGIFLCPSDQNGKFGNDWAGRGELTIGYSGDAAYDPNGCTESQPNKQGCEGFTTAATTNKMKEPSRTALFADTPGGPLGNKYRGYVFSPYNGVENVNYPELSLPLISDRDLVVELNNLPPAQLKPVYARHNKTGRDEGFTNVIFADGHAKGYSAKSIMAMENGANIIWRFR